MNTPQDDAERIRLKRLAKLQTAQTPSEETTASARSALPPTTPEPKKKKVLNPSKKLEFPPLSETNSQPTKQVKRQTLNLDLPKWEHEATQFVFKVTLDRSVAEQSGYETVWLKSLKEELEEEGSIDVQLNADLADRLLIARLMIDPRATPKDLDYLTFLVSLPSDETTFEYLVGCWKRINSKKSSLLQKGYSQMDVQKALSLLDKIRELVISYAGFSISDPEMFPQPPDRPLGASELVAPLLSLSLPSTLLSTPVESSNTLNSSDVDQFIKDLACRFEADNEIDGILGPVVRALLFHESLFRPEGLKSDDSSWRGIVGGLELLVSVKSIATMITRLPEWDPLGATAITIEKLSLMGPLCRLGVFSREWPTIAQSYFWDPEKRSRQDIESSFANLRATMKSLQSSLFQIFNTLVRASSESRESVLRYFSRVVSLNIKRAGTHVDPDSVASDSFMLNLQCVLLRFAEPFIDSTYTKIDKIDPLYCAYSSRIDLKEETRIKATSEEAIAWMKENQNPNAKPNFISEIFYLTIAMSHYGFLKTTETYTNLAKHLDDLQRHLDIINGDGSWMGSPIQSRVEMAINQVKTEQGKIRGRQLTYEVQLLDPDLVFRSIGFTTFLSTWLIRQVDPQRTHPHPLVLLPLPQEVPMAFRVLPEFVVENVVDHLFFVTQTTPEKFNATGKVELMTFAIVFLKCTWYIKNPFLKSKINDVLFMSIWGYGRERNGILGNLLNTHPMALEHLMSTLMHFYIEVEQTGASSQFYDKFNARRSIAYILKVVWNNSTHRAALKREAGNVEQFIRFVNLMINDTTYLMDESLSELVQIHNIQVEMEDDSTWRSRTPEYRREREDTLRSLERHASGYTTLSRSTVELLKLFTAETRPPFMTPEIVYKLAAMLNYNLHALVGPKYQELKVRDPDKLKFNPKLLLSDILQIYLNLKDQPEFITAVAQEGRSYSKELFNRAADVALRRCIKTEADISELKTFVDRVEDRKASIEEEDEDLGEVPEEYLDPLMATLMRDPVILPSSKVIVDSSTIKAHLLSDTIDPFNRAPLSLEEVIPDIALKARIDAFLAEKRSKKKESLENKDGAHRTDVDFEMS